jgi:hypothetical protein
MPSGVFAEKGTYRDGTVLTWTDCDSPATATGFPRLIRRFIRCRVTEVASLDRPTTALGKDLASPNRQLSTVL